jgi:mannosyltransferase OCH1-like enzyme
MKISRKRNKRLRKASRKMKKYRARGGNPVSWGEDCKYVSPRGIMESCKVHTDNPLSNYWLNDYIDYTKIKDGDTVYIRNTAIPKFVTKIQSIPVKIVLVSGDSDESIPEAMFLNDEEFKKFIESDKIIHWFSQNCVGKHPKLSGIPIGLDYHSRLVSSNPWGGKMEALDQEAELLKIKNEAKPFYERLIQCYSNFHFNKQKDRKYTYDRDEAIEKIPKNLIFYEPTPLTRLETFINQCKYAFVVSPHGNGLDCHRTWEALCLGCIVVVKTSPIDYLFDELPVLIVKDWSDVTSTLLEATVNNFKNTKFNYDKLTLKYWMDKINSGNKIKQAGGNSEVKIDNFIKKTNANSPNEILNVPLVIYRGWLTNMISVEMKEVVDNTIKMTPEFDNYFYSDIDSLEYIRNNFEPNVLNAFNCLKPGAYKSDLWRYCILYKKGGVYLDIKMDLHMPLIDIIKEYPKFFVGNVEGSNGNPKNQIWNGLMISPPGNPVFKDCIDEIVISCKNRDYRENNLDITGPCLLWRMMNKHESPSFVSSMPISWNEAEYKIFYKNKLFLSQYKEHRNYQGKVQKNPHYAIMYNNKDVFDTSIQFE